MGLKLLKFFIDELKLCKNTFVAKDIMLVVVPTQYTVCYKLYFVKQTKCSKSQKDESLHRKQQKDKSFHGKPQKDKSFHRKPRKD